MCKIDYISSYKTITIMKTNGDDITLRAFVPGDIENLISFSPELKSEVAAIWTPEIIDAWERRKTENEFTFVALDTLK